MIEFVLYDNIISAFVKHFDDMQRKYTIRLKCAMRFSSLPNVAEFIGKWRLNPADLTILRVIA